MSHKRSTHGGTLPWKDGLASVKIGYKTKQTLGPKKELEASRKDGLDRLRLVRCNRDFLSSRMVLV